jgi:DNA modification methylase
MDGTVRAVNGNARSAAASGSVPKKSRRKEAPRGPCLSWPGRTWTVGAAHPTSPPIVPEERFGEPSPDRLIHGDSLDVAHALLEEGFGGTIDLVYLDPPFASQAAYTQEVRLDGPADGRVRRTKAYEDSWPVRKSSGGAGARAEEADTEDGVGAYLDMLAPRLEAMSALLAPTGSIWVHLDWRASYLVRVLLDEVLGRQRFLNEIVWRRAPNLGRQATSGQFGRTLDTIVVYGGPNAKLHPPTRLEPVEQSSVRRDEEGRAFITAPRGDYSDASMVRLAKEGRVHKTASGRQYIKYFLVPNAAGEMCRDRRIDTLWTDIAPLRHTPIAERTGFPTQKPRALLERIIECASPEGGTVVDLFAGSGTTGDAAHAVGRTFILGDRSTVSINAARARLLRAGAAFAVESCGTLPVPSEGELVVTIEHAASGDVKALLEKPAEPVGWAVGRRITTAEGARGPFVAAWHAERRLGTVPVPAAHDAAFSLPRADKDSSSLEARVYTDDGAVLVHHPRMKQVELSL